MTVIIVVLIVIAVPFIILFTSALFIDRAYSLRRTIIINVPIEEVFNYLKCIKNQDNFNKWVMRDPDMKKTFSGTDGTVGFCYAWDGNKKAGKGEQEIKSIQDNERIEAEIRFERPFRAVAHTVFNLEREGENKTRITWSMASRQKYPMNFMNPFMNSLLGKDLEISLENLKKILEEKEDKI